MAKKAKAGARRYHEVTFDREQRLILVHGAVNGSKTPMTFIIDTGASHVCIDPSISKGKPVKRKATGAGGKFETAAGKLSSLRIGDAEVKNLPVRVFPMAPIFKAFKKHHVIGIVGAPFLEKFETLINYRTGTILFKDLRGVSSNFALSSKGQNSR